MFMDNLYRLNYLYFALHYVGRTFKFFSNENAYLRHKNQNN